MVMLRYLPVVGHWCGASDETPNTASEVTTWWRYTNLFIIIIIIIIIIKTLNT